jgi:hypothetical protein
MRKPSRVQPDPYLLSTLLLSLLAILPLLGPYFVGSHDAILAIYRFFEFDRAIQSGTLLPRWAPDLLFGYGYPFFVFYAPLAYYAAEMFHLLGLGFVHSISATFALGFLLSGLFMYLFVRDLGGRAAGLLASLAYVFAPYHLVNAHFRGDLAEFFAFVWFPATLWAGRRLIERGQGRYLALTAIFYAALLTTHNIMALIFSPLLATYLAVLLIQHHRKAPQQPNRGGYSLGRKPLYCLLAIALAFGLSAFFWLPALRHVKDVQIERLSHDPSFYYRTSLMHDSSFISDAWLQDYGSRNPEGEYGYPVEMGLVQVLLAGAAAALSLQARLRGERRWPLGGLLPFLALAALSYYALMFPWSLFLWERIPLMSFVQSPWRLLPILVLCTSVLIGYLGRFFSARRPLIAYPALALLALLLTAPNLVHLQPRYVDVAERDISVAGILKFELLSQNLGMTAAGEYLPKGVRSKMVASPLAIEALSTAGETTLDLPPFDPSYAAPGARIEVVETSGTGSQFRVQSAQGTRFLFNTTYFPGWRAYVDGQETPLDGVGTANLMAIWVPPGEHRVEFRFQDTKASLLGKAASLGSLLVLLAILLLARRKEQGPSQEQDQTGLPAPLLSPLVPAVLAIILIGLGAAYLAQGGRLGKASEATFPIEATWRGGARLLGYDLSARSLKAGQSLDLTLYWDQARAPGQSLVRVALKGWNGQNWSEDDYLAARIVGRVVQERHRLRLAKETPPGMYKIAVNLIDGKSGKPLPVAGERLARPIFPERQVLLGPVFVGRGAPLTVKQTRIQHPRRENLEGQVAFLGYNLEIGDRSLELTTFWQALTRMREDYSLFAHLMDMGGKVLTFRDIQPDATPYPTTLWRVGEVVAVPFHFDLPEGFSLNQHQLSTGLYRPYNWQRLAVLDQAGRPITDTLYLSLSP